MEYKIIAGPVEEIRRAMMPTNREGRRARRGAKAKKSSIKKILRNEINAVKSLARLLNCNFACGDLWVTLTFAGEEEISWETAQTLFGRFLRRLRESYRKKTGSNLRYVYAEGRKSGELDARPHYHIVLPAMDYEMLCALWPQEAITYRRLDGRGDYTGVARYMISNARGEEGKKKYHPSRGLKKPVYTEPVPVYAGSKIRLPKNVSIREQTEVRDDESGFYSAYVRYVRKDSHRQPSAATSLGDGGRGEKASAATSAGGRGKGGKTPAGAGDKRERKGNGARVSARSDKTNVKNSGRTGG